MITIIILNIWKYIVLKNFLKNHKSLWTHIKTLKISRYLRKHLENKHDYIIGYIISILVEVSMYVAYICKGSQIHRHYIIIIAMYSLFGKNSSNMLRYIYVFYT